MMICPLGVGVPYTFPVCGGNEKRGVPVGLGVPFVAFPFGGAVGPAPFGVGLGGLLPDVPSV